MVQIPYKLKKLIVKFRKRNQPFEEPFYNYTMLVFKNGKTSTYGINDLRDRHELLKHDEYLRTVRIVIINNRTKHYLKL